jgi:hypothetical protein
MAQQLLMTVVSKGSAHQRRERTAVMDAFFAGLVVGIAFGMVVVGFLAVGSYQRGFSQALERRKEWRGELFARQVVARRALEQLRKAS